MNLLWTKIVTMSILGIVSLLVGFIPMLVAKKVNLSEGSRGAFIVSCLNCFGGGVILTTAFTHMLPEVNLFLQYNIDKGLLSNDAGWPLAEIWILCGFFMIYFVEEVTHILMMKCNANPKNKVSAEEMREGKVNGGYGNPVNGRGRPDGHQGGHHENPPQQQQQQGHGHSHDLTQAVSTEAGFEAALRGFLVVLAISLHAVFEGIAMGLTDNARSVWLLFIAISAHKYVISFCISMQFVTSGLPALLSIIYFSTFALISPVGALIGILISETVKSEAETQTVAVTVLQALATGTLLYVVFFEVIEKERMKGTNGMVQVCFVVLGFLCMLAMEAIGFSLEPPPAAPGSPGSSVSCVLPPQLLLNITAPVNVKCEEGTLVLA